MIDSFSMFGTKYKLQGLGCFSMWVPVNDIKNKSDTTPISDLLERSTSNNTDLPVPSYN